jgi:hypothetical protein
MNAVGKDAATWPGHMVIAERCGGCKGRVRRGYPDGMETRGTNLNTPHHCMKCDYDMQGSTSGVCPECGTPFDAIAVQQAIWNSWRITRTVKWMLVAPSLSYLLIPSILCWTYSEDVLGDPPAPLILVLFILTAGPAAYAAIRAGVAIAKEQTRFRPGQTRTVAFVVLVTFYAVLFTLCQAIAAYLALVLGAFIAIFFGLIHINL